MLSLEDVPPAQAGETALIQPWFYWEAHVAARGASPLAAVESGYKTSGGVAAFPPRTALNRIRQGWLKCIQLGLNASSDTVV